LWASAAEAKPRTATVVKTKAKLRIVWEAFIDLSPKWKGVVFERTNCPLHPLIRATWRLLQRQARIPKNAQNPGKSAIPAALLADLSTAGQFLTTATNPADPVILSAALCALRALCGEIA
jgi:hypothetical protein